MQTDLFTTETAVRSFPPHLDPAKVAKWTIDEETDRDHVAAPVGGVLPPGALGTNSTTFVLRCIGKTGETLGAWARPNYRAAGALCEEYMGKLAENRQGQLL